MGGRGWSPRQQALLSLSLQVESELLIDPCVCVPVQLYEQILAENEKLKAQLRDTDLELADLKLQLEKATQVRAARRVCAGVVWVEIPDLFLCCRFRGRNATLTDLSWRWRKG